MLDKGTGNSGDSKKPETEKSGSQGRRKWPISGKKDFSYRGFGFFVSAYFHFLYKKNLRFSNLIIFFSDFIHSANRWIIKEADAFWVHVWHFGNNIKKKLFLVANDAITK